MFDCAEERATPLLEQARVKLPLFSEGVAALLSKADSEDRLDLKFLELVASRDPLGSLQLLTLANSAYVGSARTIVKVKDALQLLGAETGYTVLLQAALLTETLRCARTFSLASLNYLRKYLSSVPLTARKLQALSRAKAPQCLDLCLLIDAGGLFSVIIEEILDTKKEEEKEKLLDLDVVFNGPDTPANAALLDCVRSLDYRVHLHQGMRPFIEKGQQALASSKLSPALASPAAQVSQGMIQFDASVSPAAEATLASAAQWLVSQPDPTTLWAMAEWERRFVSKLPSLPTNARTLATAVVSVPFAT